MISTVASVLQPGLPEILERLINASEQGGLSTTVATGNFSNLTTTGEYYPEIPAYIRTTSMVFCVAIMCLGVVGNVMVPIVILKSKDMRNSTNIFLTNLSIADLLVLLVCTPTVLVEVNTRPETWVLGEEMCKAVPFVELTVAHASVLTILAISFERYYAICEPLRAGYVCTKARATLICGLAWLLAALFTSPILIVASYQYEEYFDGSIVAVCLTQADSFWPALFFISSISVFFLIPLAILVILYTIIAKNLMENPMTSAVSHGKNGNSIYKYRRQVVVMLGAVVLSFFVCLMPFRALTLWIIVVPPETIMSLGLEGYYILLYFCRIMLYINSAINPILYNLMSSKFREGFMRLLGCHRLRSITSSSDSGRKSTFRTTTSSTLSSNTDSFWRRYSSSQRTGSSPRHGGRHGRSKISTLLFRRETIDEPVVVPSVVDERTVEEGAASAGITTAGRDPDEIRRENNQERALGRQNNNQKNYVRSVTLDDSRSANEVSPRAKESFV